MILSGKYFSLTCGGLRQTTIGLYLTTRLGGKNRQQLGQNTDFCKNLHVFHTHELPMGQNRTNLMSQKGSVLQYLDLF